jgi:hypothetical protein
MFSRIHFFIFILVIIIFGYLFFLNPEEIDFTLYQDYTISISPALIAFGAFFIGAFFVFLVTLFVDTKRAFDLWRFSKRQKKEEFIRERYSDALEQMMKGNVSQAKETLAKIIEKTRSIYPPIYPWPTSIRWKGSITRPSIFSSGPKRLTPKTWSFFSTFRKTTLPARNIPGRWKPWIIFSSATRRTAGLCAKREKFIFCKAIGRKPMRPRRAWLNIRKKKNMP